MEFLPWETWFAFPGESQLWQSRATQSTVHVQVFQWLYNPSNSDMDYKIFNVRTGVNACDCTRGRTDTRKRAFTESWPWEKNPLPHRGIEPASAAWRWDALTTWATSTPNGTKRAHFRGSPLIQATYNIKTEKQTINLTYLVSVRCWEARREGKGHETDWCDIEKDVPCLYHVSQSHGS